jgi:hypothetical protein
MVRSWLMYKQRTSTMTSKSISMQKQRTSTDWHGCITRARNRSPLGARRRAGRRPVPPLPVPLAAICHLSFSPVSARWGHRRSWQGCASRPSVTNPSPNPSPSHPPQTRVGRQPLPSPCAAAFCRGLWDLSYTKMLCVLVPLATSDTGVISPRPEHHRLYTSGSAVKLIITKTA